MGYYYRQSVCIEIDSLTTPAPNTFMETRGPLIEQPQGFFQYPSLTIASSGIYWLTLFGIDCNLSAFAVFLETKVIAKKGEIISGFSSHNFPAQLHGAIVHAPMSEAKKKHEK